MILVDIQSIIIIIINIRTVKKGKTEIWDGKISE